MDRRPMEMFSEARIAFEKELTDNHPDIIMKILLASYESGFDSEGITIGTVAAEFNIVMDGMYSRDQIEHLYDMLTVKLRERGQLVIHDSDTGIIDADGFPAVSQKPETKH